MNDIAIRVTNLSKLYRIGVEERRPQGVAQAARSLLSSPSSPTCSACCARPARKKPCGRSRTSPSKPALEIVYALARLLRSAKMWYH